ncbi:hypothetical protein Ancab_035706 [Ancistrocladus abbreviatus]
MVGDRRSIFFWEDIWVVDQKLKDLFHRGCPFAWELGAISILLEHIARMRLKEGVDDDWKWLADSVGSFSKSLKMCITYCYHVRSPERKGESVEAYGYSDMLVIMVNKECKDLSAKRGQRRRCVIKEDIKVTAKEDVFLICMMEDTRGDGLGNDYPWTVSNSLSQSDNDCLLRYGKDQGYEVSNSSAKASDLSLPAIDRGKCLRPLEIESTYNDGTKPPANGKSRLQNSLSVQELGSCDGFNTQKEAFLQSMWIYWRCMTKRIVLAQVNMNTVLRCVNRAGLICSIAFGLNNLAHLDIIGDRTSNTSFGTSKDLFNRGLVYSIELPGNRTPSNRQNQISKRMLATEVNQHSSEESRSS